MESNTKSHMNFKIELEISRKNPNYARRLPILWSTCYLCLPLVLLWKESLRNTDPETSGSIQNTFSSTLRIFTRSSY